jgi:hypothetical protein
LLCSKRQCWTQPTNPFRRSHQRLGRRFVTLPSSSCMQSICDVPEVNAGYLDALTVGASLSVGRSSLRAIEWKATRHADLVHRDDVCDLGRRVTTHRSTCDDVSDVHLESGILARGNILRGKTGLSRRANRQSLDDSMIADGQPCYG